MYHNKRPYIGIHKATREEVSELAMIIEKATGEHLQTLYVWMTDRSDKGRAADPDFVISRMKEKLFR